MTSKIRIKMGFIEVEFEGSEQFLKEELPDLLTGVSQLHSKSSLASEDDQGLGLTRFRGHFIS